MGRAPCCEKVGLKRGRWTAEEDEKLAKYIKANGEGSWRSLPKNAGLLRCGKSCRLRWINYLRADVKRGNISKDEEETIVKLHASLGNRWSLIASHLPGRTDNEIKNYWNSHLSRRIRIFQKNGVGDTPVVVKHGKLTKSDKRREHDKKKKPIFGVNIEKEKQEKVSVLTTSSSIQIAKGNSMLLDFEPQQANSLTSKILDSGTLGINDDTGIGLLSPSQMVDGGFWDEVEGGLFSVNENSVSWGSNEERQSGVICSSEEREGEALVLNEGNDDGFLAYNEGRVKTLGEEIESIELEKMLDWDLDGMEANLWDAVGDMWTWQWDSGNGEFELQGMEGSVYQEKPFDTWLL